MDRLTQTLKAAYPRALATLIRRIGDIDAAEDAVQDAVTRALVVWPSSGTPQNPVAWLVTTGRNTFIDAYRRQKLHDGYCAQLSIVAKEERASGEMDERRGGSPADDDLLRLIFTCCHPALAQDAQVALTLKTVAGLTVAEIAHAFLVPTQTMEQRLTRAKRKIRAAGIPYEVPSTRQLPERLEAVLAVIYLLFNADYSASNGSDFSRPDLCTEAIRLARMLSRLFRAEAEVTGLLALLLLQHARRSARFNQTGNLIPLAEQNRTCWDQRGIMEGRMLVEKALRQQRPGPYQIQAAIAAVHCEAASATETDWRQIAELYHILERYQPSPVVTLNRAVAVAQVHGAAAGIAILQTIEQSPHMQRYQYFYSALGVLLAELSRPQHAIAAYTKALSLTHNPDERAALQQEIAALK